MKILLIGIFYLSMTALASEDHHDHDEESHQEHPAVNKSVAVEKDGFKISIQAEKNFDIRRVSILKSAPIKIPKSAIVTAGEEVNIYRYRQGNYRRIDFEFISKSSSHALIKSADLKIGDEIVTQGIDFLRLAEITAFGGGAEGHSH